MFTGERLTTHLHRSFFALPFCAGKSVLVASGEGYGSALFASVSSAVVGIDVAAEAVQHAAQNYTADNLSFLCGDARQIPPAAGSIEIVASFETIEHWGEPEEFIRALPMGATNRNLPEQFVKLYGQLRVASLGAFPKNKAPKSVGMS